jgi:hypothetical protein
MTQFGAKLHAFKSSRTTDADPESSLTFERLQANQKAGIETNFVTDNNLMIQIDDACESSVPATDAALEKFEILEWVNFLRLCDSQDLHYTFTPYFAYAEMPAKLAQSRAARLHKFAKKFGLVWHDNDLDPDFSGVGRTDFTFDGLDQNHQTILGLSFSALLLMLLINRDGEEFSPLGKFNRYLREYKRLIGTVSLKEIAIARYVFSTQADCPGPLDNMRSHVERNFARKNKKHPKNIEDMCATALNGAFDLLLFNAMNIADTKGLDGRRLDCWLVTLDGKLKLYNDLCYSVGMGTNQAGLFTMITTHTDVSEYWQKTSEILHKFALDGSKRALESMLKRANGMNLEEEKAIRMKIAALPDKARSVIALAEAGL